MSYFCQFCDKEMVLEASAVHEEGYITCGKAQCISQARSTAESLRKERELKTVRLLIFKSKTPEDTDTWRVVPKDQYPEFITDREVAKGLFEGYVIGMQTADGGDPEMFYCARKADDVLRQINKARLEKELEPFENIEDSGIVEGGDNVDK